MGSDDSIGYCCGVSWEFQSTLPHGERLRCYIGFPLQSNFNPRSRMGSDLDGPLADLQLDISIHAPAWGATWARILRMR